MQQTGHVATDILKENENLRIRLEKAEGMLRAMRGDDAEAPILLAEADPQDRTLPGREAKANRVPAEMLAQIADAVIAIDENNQITYLSPSAERLYGIAASDALGRPLADVFSPPWLKTDDEMAVAIALRDHGEWTGENVHVASDGRAMNVEMRISSLKDEEGQTNCRIAAIRDVSSRKQNEKQLLVSEIRYRRLFEAAHDGVLIVDAATRKIVDANPFMTGLLGYPHADLVGMEIFEIGLFTDAQASQDMFQALNISGQMRYENLPLQTEDGALCEVEVVANRYDENGHSFIQFNVRDITERKLTQKALSDTDNRFRLALENSHITVFEQDLDLRYTWIYDPKLRSAANEVLGKTDADLMDAAIARQLTTIKREVLETGQPVNREVAGGIAGQAPEYFDLKVEPRRDANGRIN